MHSQPATSSVFKNITVKNSTMKGLTKYPNSPAMRFIGVENLNISNNVIDGFGRGVEIRNIELSKNANGDKVETKSNYGLSKNVLIENNTIKNASGMNKATGIYILSKTDAAHNNIIIKNNRFIENQNNPNELYYMWVEDIDNLTDMNNEHGALKIYKNNVN